MTRKKPARAHATAIDGDSHIFPEWFHWLRSKVSIWFTNRICCKKTTSQ